MDYGADTIHNATMPRQKTDLTLYAHFSTEQWYPGSTVASTLGTSNSEPGPTRLQGIRTRRLETWPMIVALLEDGNLHRLRMHIV